MFYTKHIAVLPCSMAPSKFSLKIAIVSEVDLLNDEVSVHSSSAFLWVLSAYLVQVHSPAEKLVCFVIFSDCVLPLDDCA